jgi:hypothetical protein
MVREDMKNKYTFFKLIRKQFMQIIILKTKLIL